MHAQLHLLDVLGLFILYLIYLLIESPSQRLVIHQFVLQLIQLLLLRLQRPLPEVEILNVDFVLVFRRGDPDMLLAVLVPAWRRTVHASSLLLLLAVLQRLVESETHTYARFRVLVADEGEVEPVIVEYLFAGARVNDTTDLDFVLVQTQELVTVIRKGLGLLHVL